METDRVPTGKHRPPMPCRNTNWQLVRGQAQAAILETTSVVDKLEIALLLTSVESSAISLWGVRFLSSGLFVDTYSSQGHSGFSSVRFPDRSVA